MKLLKNKWVLAGLAVLAFYVWRRSAVGRSGVDTSSKVEPLLPADIQRGQFGGLSQVRLEQPIDLSNLVRIG